MMISLNFTRTTSSVSWDGKTNATLEETELFLKQLQRTIQTAIRMKQQTENLQGSADASIRKK